MFLLAVNQTLNNDELIKEMQEKVVALQDHEISFLNDTIANMWAIVGIGTGLIVAIAGIVGWIIRRSNAQAETKMQEAELKMNEATQKIANAESLVNTATETIEKLEGYRNEVNTYRVDTEQKVRELSSMIDEKMKSLKELESKTNNLTLNHKARALLVECEMSLEHADFRRRRLPQLYGYNPEQENPEYTKLVDTQKLLMGEYQSLTYQLQRVGLDKVIEFHQECLELKVMCRAFVEEVEAFAEKIREEEFRRQEIEMYYENGDPVDTKVASPE
ncbi:hypothetical protein ABE036_25815 [Priestia aryabhattai]|uniref:hypothetical protein n=1 Tax=Priestia aryabhattai TaxID=412384 RepID=UPI003D2B7A5B